MKRCIRRRWKNEDLPHTKQFYKAPIVKIHPQDKCWLQIRLFKAMLWSYLEKISRLLVLQKRNLPSRRFKLSFRRRKIPAKTWDSHKQTTNECTVSPGLWNNCVCSCLVKSGDDDCALTAEKCPPASDTLGHSRLLRALCIQHFSCSRCNPFTSRFLTMSLMPETHMELLLCRWNLQMWKYYRTWARDWYSMIGD